MYSWHIFLIFSVFLGSCVSYSTQPGTPMNDTYTFALNTARQCPSSCKCPQLWQNNQVANNGIKTIPKDTGGIYAARSAYLSEKHWEVLSALCFPDSFPSTAFRSFDHQRKTDSLCRLEGTEQTDVFRGWTVSPPPGQWEGSWALAPQALCLPPSPPLHLSHNPGCKCLRGQRFFLAAADCLLPTPPSTLERHKESWVLPKGQRDTQQTNHRAAPHQSRSRPGPWTSRTQTRSFSLIN